MSSSFDRGFCLIPKKLSPHNKLMRVTLLDGKRATGWNIRTQFRTMTPFFILTFAALLGQIDLSRLSIDLPKALMRFVKEGKLALQPAAISAGVASKLASDLYDFSRPKYDLFDERTGQVYATGAASLRATGGFEFIARDLLHQPQILVAHWEGDQLQVVYKDHRFVLPRLPSWRAYSYTCCGFRIEASRALINALEFGSSIRVRPLNVFHSRRFCLHQVSGENPVPPSLMALLIYYWEHNGALSLLQVAWHSRLFQWQRTHWKLWESRRVLNKDLLQDEWTALWLRLLSSRTTEEDFNKVMQAQRQIHGSSSLQLTWGQRQILVNDLSMRNFPQLEVFWAQTLADADIDFQLKKTEVAQTADQEARRANEARLRKFRESFRKLTTRDVDVNIVRLDPRVWTQILTDSARSYGKELARNELTELLQSKLPAPLAWSQRHLLNPLLERFTASPTAKEMVQDSWLRRNAAQDVAELYFNLTGEAFPLTQPQLELMRSWELTTLHTTDVNVAFEKKLSQLGGIRWPSTIDNAISLAEQYHSLIARRPDLVEGFTQVDNPWAYSSLEDALETLVLVTKISEVFFGTNEWRQTMMKLFSEFLLNRSVTEVVGIVSLYDECLLDENQKTCQAFRTWYEFADEDRLTRSAIARKFFGDDIEARYLAGRSFPPTEAPTWSDWLSSLGSGLAGKLNPKASLEEQTAAYRLACGRFPLKTVIQATEEFRELRPPDGRSDANWTPTLNETLLFVQKEHCSDKAVAAWKALYPTRSVPECVS